MNLWLGESYKTKGPGTGGGHRTDDCQASSSDIKILSWEQDLREDDGAYQHTPFPDSVCLENDGRLGGCLWVQTEAAPSEVPRGSLQAAHQ